MKLYELSAEKIHAMIAAREVKAEEVLESVLGRIEQVEPRINAFTTLTADAARDSARQADSVQTAAYPIPCGIKDNICTRGVRTSCSSKILDTFIPPYDATVASKIREAGGVVVGKMNMDEFAMGSSTENSGFFPTHNPWDLSRVPGGSSGGAAAAVAAQEVFYALGSDTGGSIRQPASFCGVVGLKPTYGVVSRYGLVAFASSLDQIGPITRSVSDCAAVLNLIGGHDPLDSTSLPADKVDYRRFLQRDIKGMRIGYPREYFQKGVDDAVKEVVKRALLKYEELGAIVEETSLPHSEYAMPAYYIIATAEASTNLARFEGVRYGYRNAEAEDIVEMMSRSRAEAFGSEVKLRIMLGTYALSSGYYDAYYLKALKVRRLIKEDFDAAFKRYDLLVSPVATSTAFPMGEKCDDPLAMYMSDILTIPVNLAGIPAMSIPGGLVDGLPVGVHLMGPPLSEGALLKAAYAFEQATEHHLNTPNLEV